MKDLVIEFFQDKGFRRVKYGEEGHALSSPYNLFLTDDKECVMLEKDGTFEYLIWETIGRKKYFNFRINISAMDKEQLFYMLNFFFFREQYERLNENHTYP